ncbi:MAG: DsbA family protein [Acidimicrobiales bacterium]
MTSFAVTYDYRCPFARIGHLHVIEALEAGQEWDVTFLPFSLRQAHVEDGDPPVWDDPESDSGLLALQVSVVVRDRHPEAFLTVHRRLFDLRHVDSADLRDPEVLSGALRETGIDPESVFAEIGDGWPLQSVRAAHEGAIASHNVWGVPTFLIGDEAVFVRLMEAPDGEAATAVRTVERVLETVSGWPQLNELKHTSIRR